MKWVWLEDWRSVIVIDIPPFHLVVIEKSCYYWIKIPFTSLNFSNYLKSKSSNFYKPTHPLSIYGKIFSFCFRMLISQSGNPVLSTDTKHQLSSSGLVHCQILFSSCHFFHIDTRKNVVECTSWLPSESMKDKIKAFPRL